MAGGKLTPRQKMINLMYLVFIAMLAMNMSKEVLSAFGLMNEKFEDVNTSSTETNEQMLQALKDKAAEAKGEFEIAAATGIKVQAATKKFYDFVATLKEEVLVGVETDENGKLPYEAMDKADNLDHSWFTGDGYTARGNEVMKAIETYKAEMKAALGNEKKYAAILKEVEKKFDLSDVTNKEGIKIKYLDYHFKGFPAIASLAKLSAWQNDVKKTEADVYSAALGKAAVQAASYSNYKAIVVLDKNAYFQGDQVTGKVVLGRYDENTKPTSFDGPGKLENGQAVISLTAGSVGEQTIKGKFTFTEDGKDIPLEFEGKYVVVPRPNSANISADKMNVVYIGVDNPMTISFAGISDSDVSASAPGLTKAAGNGKYIWRPQGGQEATVTVTGKLPDGKAVTDKKTFRVKPIPAPATSLRGATGTFKGSKENLVNSPVGVKFNDFDFDVKVSVISFEVKAPGSGIIVCQGDRFSPQAIAAINKAPKGEAVMISNVKSRIEGTNVPIKESSPFVWEIQ